MSFIKILFSQIIYNFYTINVDPTNVDKVENWIIIFPLYRRNFKSGWPTMTFNVCCFLITYSFLSYYSLEILSILNCWLDRFSSYGWHWFHATTKTNNQQFYFANAQKFTRTAQIKQMRQKHQNTIFSSISPSFSCFSYLNLTA